MVPRAIAARPDNQMAAGMWFFERMFDSPQGTKYLRIEPLPEFKIEGDNQT
jgi:hypothetical protein